jgi:hypothetical protein
VVAEAWSWATGPPDSHPSWRPPAMRVLSVSRAQRCADRRFPRSPASVRGQGMRSNSPRPDGGRMRCPWAPGKVSRQPVAGKVMGLPGGCGSPIGRA